MEAALALLEGGARPDGRGIIIGPDHPRNETRPSSDESDSYVSDSDISEHPGEWEGDLTPLHLACAGGHTAVVRALLSAGERTDRIASGRKVRGLDIGPQHNDNPPVADHFGGIGIRAVAPFLGGEGGGRDGGHTPLHLASVCGAVGAVRALVEAGACVHLRARDFDDTPLHLASASGHLEVMAVLLEAGADVNAGDEIGNTPLHVARDVQTLEFLLARGANPNLVAISRYGSGSPLGSYCTLIHRLETDDKGMARATAQVQGHGGFLPRHILYVPVLLLCAWYVALFRFWGPSSCACSAACQCSFEFPLPVLFLNDGLLFVFVFFCHLFLCIRWRRYCATVRM